MREKPNAAPAPSRGRGPGTEEEVAAVVVNCARGPLILELLAKYTKDAFMVDPIETPLGIVKLSVLLEKLRSEPATNVLRDK